MNIIQVLQKKSNGLCVRRARWKTMRNYNPRHDLQYVMVELRQLVLKQGIREYNILDEFLIHGTNNFLAEDWEVGE